VAQDSASFITKYIHQGYYRDSNCREVPLYELPSLLRVEEIPIAMTPAEAYVKYIQDNMDRIGRDGWVPVCFGEFIESEECDIYLFPEEHEDIEGDIAEDLFQEECAEVERLKDEKRGLYPGVADIAN
jgi:hypothetical protein